MARMGREVVVGVALLLIQCTSGLDISEEVPSHKQAPVNYDADSQVPQRMTDKDNDEETAYEVLDPVFHEFESEEEFWKKHGEDPFHPWLIFVYAPTCEKSNNYTEVHRKVIAEDEGTQAPPTTRAHTHMPQHTSALHNSQPHHKHRTAKLATRWHV